MLFLCLAVLCSVSIGMIFKVAGERELDRTALLTINYAAAVGVAGVLIAIGGRGAANGLTLSMPCSCWVSERERFLSSASSCCPSQRT